MTKTRAGVLLGLFLGGAVSVRSWAQQTQPGPEASSPLRPLRTVEGTVVTSLADPPLRVQVPQGFKYAGGQRFLLREVADAEQHLFVEADSGNAVTRLYWIQFEQFLPGRGGRYAYEGDQPVEVSGLAMRANVRRFTEPPAPDSDRRSAYDLLERAGYRVPGLATRVRLVYLPDPDGRQEVMFIYLEAAATGSEVPAEERAAILQRATAGLSVRAKEIGAGKVSAEPAGIGRETVVLMHGLGRSPRSMNRLEKGLVAEGYSVANLAYESRRQSVEEIAENLYADLARRGLESEPRVHFVTHSLGGIVLRHYLRGHRPANLGRVVMLGPPNGGSELVDLLRRLPVLRHHPGPARGQLGTGAASLPARLGPVDFELGVIAGTRSWNPLSLCVLPGPDDGVVPVARARVDGMTGFLTVRRTHTFMMRGSDVIEQTIGFLRTGRFARKPRNG